LLSCLRPKLCHIFGRGIKRATVTTSYNLEKNFSKSLLPILKGLQSHLPPIMVCFIDEKKNFVFLHKDTFSVFRDILKVVDHRNEQLLSSHIAPNTTYKKWELEFRVRWDWDLIEIQVAKNIVTFNLSTKYFQVAWQAWSAPRYSTQTFYQNLLLLLLLLVVPWNMLVLLERSTESDERYTYVDELNIHVILFSMVKWIPQNTLCMLIKFAQRWLGIAQWGCFIHLKRNNWKKR